MVLWTDGAARANQLCALLLVGLLLGNGRGSFLVWAGLEYIQFLLFAAHCYGRLLSEKRIVHHNEATLYSTCTFFYYCQSVNIILELIVCNFSINAAGV